jgi:hypothetical protein
MTILFYDSFQSRWKNGVSKADKNAPFPFACSNIEWIVGKADQTFADFDLQSSYYERNSEPHLKDQPLNRKIEDDELSPYVDKLTEQFAQLQTKQTSSPMVAHFDCETLRCESGSTSSDPLNGGRRLLRNPSVNYLASPVADNIARGKHWVEVKKAFSLREHPALPFENPDAKTGPCYVKGVIGENRQHFDTEGCQLQQHQPTSFYHDYISAVCSSPTREVTHSSQSTFDRQEVRKTGISYRNSHNSIPSPDPSPKPSPKSSLRPLRINTAKSIGVAGIPEPFINSAPLLSPSLVPKENELNFAELGEGNLPVRNCFRIFMDANQLCLMNEQYSVSGKDARTSVMLKNVPNR